jgi:glutaconyl-CoA/methylmalonyl-CoA decarboxylase subunit gamma
MRVVLDRAGSREVVDVAPDLTSVTVAGKRFPLQVVATGPNRVELEIDGEKVVVENWPDHFPVPYGPVDVNGERWPLKLETSEEKGEGTPVAPSGPAAASPSARSPSASTGSASGEQGIPVIPSMPGRVIELRVAEGDNVTKGQTLLILEAMKMRGEVSSPATGTVHAIRVSAGANARAKEPMMWIRPETPSP